MIYVAKRIADMDIRDAGYRHDGSNGSFLNVYLIKTVELIKSTDLDFLLLIGVMLWMGAAAGQRSCIANVIRICIRYSNLDILEDAYGINMLPLANFAQRTYEGDPCKCFQVKNGEDYNDIDRHIAVLMHKAITVIQFKLEGQLIKRHKDFEMEDRLLLDKINYDTGMINCYGKEYKMLDMNEQREIIYKERRRVLDGESMRDAIYKMISDTVEELVDLTLSADTDPSEWNEVDLNEALLPIIPVKAISKEELTSKSIGEIKQTLKERAVKLYEAKEEEFPETEQLRELERVILLKVIDARWMDHIDDMVQTVPRGMVPGSDTANLSVLGYDPNKFYTGRSPLEALSIGVDMKPTDVAMRCNIVTLTEKDAPYEEQVILDHSSDEISTEDAAVLLDAVKAELETDEFKFYLGTSYRHLLIWNHEYVNSTEVVVVNAASPAVTAADTELAGSDLNGKVVAVQQGNIADSWVSSTDNCKPADVKRYTKFAQASEDLKNGKVDCIVMDKSPAEELVASNSDLKIMSVRVGNTT